MAVCKLCFVEIIKNKEVGNDSMPGLIGKLTACFPSALSVDYGGKLFLKGKTAVV